ncbi:MAG: hypothetical protein JWN62_4110 [Acidimicrobiales bacterium]|nr:hypothetical protein [Acidimicrobiales bacterium]
MTAIFTSVDGGADAPGASDATFVDAGTGGPPESTSTVVVAAPAVVPVGASDATRAVVDGAPEVAGTASDEEDEAAAAPAEAPLKVGVVTGSDLPNITYTTPTVTMHTAINGAALRRARRSWCTRRFLHCATTGRSDANERHTARTGVRNSIRSRHDAIMHSVLLADSLLGDDLIVWLVLAMGGALLLGNVLALVKPPPAPKEGELAAAPRGRSVFMALIGLMAAVWALASIVTK